MAGLGTRPHSSRVGFGGLFSLDFVSDAAAQLFYDHLSCHKGPSLGTNFTLACPYTILAHYAELGWAASCGVHTNLIRVSVGLEDHCELVRTFEDALSLTENAVAGMQ